MMRRPVHISSFVLVVLSWPFKVPYRLSSVCRSLLYLPAFVMNRIAVVWASSKKPYSPC